MPSNGDQAGRPFRARKATFDCLYHSNVVGINVGDLEGRILDANDAFLGMIGYSRSELESGQVRWDGLAAPDYRQADQDAMADLMRVGYSPLREKVYLHKDGHRLPTLVGVTLLVEPNRSIAVVVDITKQQERLDRVTLAKEALASRVAERTSELEASNQELLIVQHQLREVAAEKFFVEERERRRIAEGLHDRVAQLLAVARMRLGALDYADEEKLRRATEEAEKEIGDAIQEVRSMIFEINPPVLYDLGFAAAAEWLVDEFDNKYNLQCELEVEATLEQLADGTRAALFQSLRELLLNVVRHASTDQAQIRVRNTADCVEIQVEDDGCGFQTETDLDHAPSPGGYGLFSIRDRLALLGGYMRIESQVDIGTCVTLTVPLVVE